MDDFSVFGNSFRTCLSHLDKILKQYEDTNLCLNWEKTHFMVKEGIVLGHKISKNRIKVDKAKVDVIAKLPHPTTVKGIRSFLGHVGFYRRFIYNFLKIAQSMTQLLKKDTPFIFSKECIEAFQSIKNKLTKAPILVAPNWDLPFELICDASAFAIGAVLGQRKTKHFQPIHYTSKTMTDAQAHYTTTEKELLAMGCHPDKKNKFFKDVKGITFGTTPSCLKCVRIKSSGGVFMAKKPLIFLRLVTMNPTGDIMAQTTPLKRCLTLVAIGPQSIVIPMTWSNLVTLVNVSEKCHNVMKCLKMPSKFARFLTYGALISWGRSRLHEGINYWASGSLQPWYKKNLGKDHRREPCLLRKTKRIHDFKIKYHVFNVGDRVLLFNSRLKIFSGKLKTRWTRPFIVTQVLPYGTVKLSQTDGPNFKVNGHRLKHYFREDIPPMVVPDL
uniref:Reverse transcriptase domain-containing protein n=1 Tax=Tanacetum cinerariifolium TaxID=118510 RepID=A0A6L2J7I2_TANCI|nr:reverse transcriptase domain-containing protein [Tanacetum cinerariifolium]